MPEAYNIEDTSPLSVQEAATSYGMTKDHMAAMLGVSEKTYYNMMQKPLLDKERSDRFQFISQILESGEEAFGAKLNFSKWLKTPQPTLDGYIPIDMMSTITGANRVLQIIGRIKHGITA